MVSYDSKVEVQGGDVVIVSILLMTKYYQMPEIKRNVRLNSNVRCLLLVLHSSMPAT